MRIARRLSALALVLGLAAFVGWPTGSAQRPILRPTNVNASAPQTRVRELNPGLPVTVQTVNTVVEEADPEPPEVQPASRVTGAALAAQLGVRPDALSDTISLGPDSGLRKRLPAPGTEVVVFPQFHRFVEKSRTNGERTTFIYLIPRGPNREAVADIRLFNARQGFGYVMTCRADILETGRTVGWREGILETSVTNQTGRVSLSYDYRHTGPSNRAQFQFFVRTQPGSPAPSLAGWLEGDFCDVQAYRL